MKLNHKFRERGQAALLIVCVICFAAGYFVSERADALLDILFAICVFLMILLEIVCRRIRPGQRLFTRKAKINLACAGAYLLVFVVHGALVFSNARLPDSARTIMSLVGSVSLLALLLHDWKAGKKR